MWSSFSCLNITQIWSTACRLFCLDKNAILNMDWRWKSVCVPKHSSVVNDSISKAFGGSPPNLLAYYSDCEMEWVKCYDRVCNSSWRMHATLWGMPIPSKWGFEFASPLLSLDCLTQATRKSHTVCNHTALSVASDVTAPWGAIWAISKQHLLQPHVFWVFFF